MNYELAKTKLMIHGSFIANSDEWPNGFLGLLKPYRSRINDSVFYDMIECLRAVFPYVNDAKVIDSQIATGVQGILHYGRSWVLDENSGLRKSGRISQEELQSIESWLTVISDIYTYMLWMKVDEHYLFNDFLQKQLAIHQKNLSSPGSSDIFQATDITTQ